MKRTILFILFLLTLRCGTTTEICLDCDQPPLPTENCELPGPC